MAINGIESRAVLEQFELEPENFKSRFYRLRYGTGKALQLAPGVAGLFCGTAPANFGGPDYTDGGRLVIFDDPDNLERAENVALCENEVIGDLDSGAARLAMRSNPWAWFVPAGARRADGTPHPGAGTGFGLGTVLEVAIAPGLKMDYQDLLHRSTRRTELYRFAWLDGTFRVTGVSRLKPDRMPEVPTALVTAQMKAVAGGDLSRLRWQLTGPGLGTGLPDGDDLLMPAMAKRPGRDAEKYSRESAGVMRWRLVDDCWAPVDFTPIAITAAPGEQYWHEPSLTRCPDGSLAFLARPRFGPYEHTIRAWRSTDGFAWEVVFDRLRARAESPVTINAAADGTVYLAFNPHRPDHEARAYGYGRRKLVLRPMSGDLRDWKEPVVAREEGTGEPELTRWYLDHPIGSTVRLGDGRRRHLLCYRALFRGRAGELASETGRQGLCVAEVSSDGPASDPWNFAD